MANYDRFYHFGTLFGYRNEHQSIKNALASGATYPIASVEGYSHFHDTIEAVTSALHIIEDNRVALYVQTSCGALIPVENVYKLEKEQGI